MHQESRAEFQNPADPEQPTKKSRLERIAGPAVFAGCFVIWPATNLACAYLGLKTMDKQLEVARIKDVADAVAEAAKK